MAFFVALARSKGTGIMADLEDELAAAGAGPKRVVIDGQSVEQFPLPELIEADKHLRRTTAAARTSLPIRLVKLRPPGTV